MGPETLLLAWTRCLAVEADREVVLAAVARHGLSLEFAVPELRGDAEALLFVFLRGACPCSVVVFVRAHCARWS